MSISNKMSSINTNRFIVPCAGKMFKSSISGGDKALCYVLNKGYFETLDLENMLYIVDDAIQNKDFILVGKIEKVQTKTVIVYRQRLFFKSLHGLLLLCKRYGIAFEVLDSFQIDINNTMNVTSELKYLEHYAKRFNETIDKWLTNTCLIELYFYIKSLGIETHLERRVHRFLKQKIDYLDRAPFLISSYNITNKTSGIFLNYNPLDSRLFDEVSTGLELLKIGYTDNNVKKDIQLGVFSKKKGKT